MKLQRNLSDDGTGKYALIRLDKLREAGLLDHFIGALESGGFIFGPQDDAQDLNDFVELNRKSDPEEAVVLKLKDQFAPVALYAYADCWTHADPEFANDIAEMATIAKAMPNRKMAD